MRPNPAFKFLEMPNLASERYNPAFLRPKTASVKLRIISERLFFSILEANFTLGEDGEERDFKALKRERKGVRKQGKEEILNSSDQFLSQEDPCFSKP